MAILSKKKPKTEAKVKKPISGLKNLDILPLTA